MVDGIFWVWQLIAIEKKLEETINFLENNKIPYCLIDRDMFDIGKYKISVDHLQGAYLADRTFDKIRA